MEINAKKLGENIKKRRNELGISQTQLAQKIGKVSPAYIAFIEAGDRNISSVDLMRLARELGTTVADLVGEKSELKADVIMALRADRGLSKPDREKIEEYYNMLKNRNPKKDE